jgi:hypothetical protein
LHGNERCFLSHDYRPKGKAAQSFSQVIANASITWKAAKTAVFATANN